MPLYPNALALIRANLEALQRGENVSPVAIGILTDVQLAAINASRASLRTPQPPNTSEILFLGRHIYNSRIAQDGYTIDDVIDQITSATVETAAFVQTHKMTAIQNHQRRPDRYGSMVQDMAVFECTAKHPRPELLSVIPKGDKPPKQRAARSGPLHKKVNDSPG